MKKKIVVEWDWDSDKQVRLPWCSKDCPYSEIATDKCHKISIRVHEAGGICWPAVYEMSKELKRFKSQRK
jgi:hypothetical protein